MTLRVLQLNIWQGAFLPEIITYVKKHDFDILHFQEVTGGIYSRGGSNMRTDGQTGFVDAVRTDTQGIDSYTVLQQNLDNYTSFNVPTWRYTKDKNSYHGIATFVKNPIQTLNHEEIWMRPYRDYDDPGEYDPRFNPRVALALLLKIGSEEIFDINTHLAWDPTPNDNEMKIAQSKILYDYLKKHDKPILLTGDFNVNTDTKTATQFNEFGINLSEINHLTNTLNPRTHHAKTLFPTGLAVDFIFAPKNSTVKNFRVIDDTDLSDHFGLEATLEL